MRRSKIVWQVLGFFLLQANSAWAVQQCFYNSTQVGATTITRTCNGSSGSYNLDSDGVGYVFYMNGTGTNCTFTFNPAVDTTTTTIQSQILNLNDQEGAVFSLNGTRYTLTQSDINTALNPPTPGPSPFVLDSNTNSVVSQNGASYANGTVEFSSQVPSSVSSVTVEVIGTPKKGSSSMIDAVRDEKSVVVFMTS